MEITGSSLSVTVTSRVASSTPSYSLELFASTIVCVSVALSSAASVSSTAATVISCAVFQLSVLKVSVWLEPAVPSLLFTVTSELSLET